MFVRLSYMLHCLYQGIQRVTANKSMVLCILLFTLTHTVLPCLPCRIIMNIPEILLVTCKHSGQDTKKHSPCNILPIQDKMIVSQSEHVLLYDKLKL